MEDDILTETLTHNLALNRNQWSISNPENFTYKKKSPITIRNFFANEKECCILTVPYISLFIGSVISIIKLTSEVAL